MVPDVPVLGAVAEKGMGSLGLSLLLASVLLLVATLPLLLRSAALTDVRPRRSPGPARGRAPAAWTPRPVREPKHWVDRLFAQGAEGDP